MYFIFDFIKMFIWNKKFVLDELKLFFDIQIPRVGTQVFPVSFKICCKRTL